MLLDSLLYSNSRSDTEAGLRKRRKKERKRGGQKERKEGTRSLKIWGQQRMGCEGEEGREDGMGRRRGGREEGKTGWRSERGGGRGEPSKKSEGGICVTARKWCQFRTWSGMKLTTRPNEEQRHLAGKKESESHCYPRQRQAG